MKWTAGNRDNIEDVRARSGGGVRMGGLGLGGLLIVLILSWATGVDFLSLVGPDAISTGPSRQHRRRPRRRVPDDAGGREARRLRRRRDGGRAGDVAGQARRPLPADAGGRLPRCHPVGVRLRAVGDRSFLLSGRPARLSRPWVLWRAAATASGRPATSPRPTCSRTSSAITCSGCSASRRRCGGSSSRIRRRRTSSRSGSSCRPTVLRASGGNQAAQPGRAAQGKVELETGDLEEGLNAAASIGDDRIQRMSGGRVAPDRFTHGSSEQRVSWFRRGLQSGNIQVCDTFQ